MKKFKLQRKNKYAKFIITAAVSLGLFAGLTHCVGENDKLSLEKSGSNLSVVVISDNSSENNGEMYGYIYYDGDKTMFNDVLNNNVYDITDKDVYSINVLSILESKDYNYCNENKKISRETLSEYENKLSVYIDDENVFIYPTSNNGVTYMKKIDAKTNR